MTEKEDIKDQIELYSTALKQNKLNRKYLENKIKNYKKRLKNL